MTHITVRPDSQGEHCTLYVDGERAAEWHEGRCENPQCSCASDHFSAYWGAIPSASEMDSIPRVVADR